MSKKQTIIINVGEENKKKTNESDNVKTVKDVNGFKLKETLKSQEDLLLAEIKKFGICLSDTVVSLFKACFYTLNVICMMAFMIVRNIVKNANKESKKKTKKESKENKPFELKI